MLLSKSTTPPKRNRAPLPITSSSDIALWTWYSVTFTVLGSTTIYSFIGTLV